MNIKILLADDHQMVRAGLRALLERQPGFEVVGEAENGRAILHLAQEVAADVVVMDVGMPDLNGIDATRQLSSIAPGLKVIGLSMHSHKRFVKEMLRAGASGYLSKDSAFDELCRAVQVVVAGQVYLSPQIAGPIVKDYVSQSSSDDVSVFTALTHREREVLQLLAEGRSAKQIANHLSISVKTVETHRQQLMTKLGIGNLADLVRYAIREGLSSIEPVKL
jgi:two-component system, NarL family, response regulator NreC